MDDTGFRSAVIGGAAVIGLALFYLRFCGAEGVPPLPPAPVTTISDAKATSLEIGERGDVYAQRLAEDARRFDVDDVTLEAMSKVFPHRADRTERVLASGESTDVLGLRLSLSIKDVTRNSKQMELVIDNPTDKYLAYRIITRPSKGTSGCSNKESVRHNAIVIAPKQIMRRSECMFQRGLELEIGKVEVVEVPKLSYFYLSAMPPIELGIDKRVAVGHRAPTGVPRCQLVLSARIKRAFERGEVLWRDLVDFYARHTCEKYRIPHDYRAFAKDSDRELPAPGSVR